MNKIIGIYKITNPKGAVYIGESINIFRRWNYEYKKLRCKKQSKLYNSFVKYGVENHTFEIIKECSIEEIPYYERHYQEFYNVLDREFGLNLKYRSTIDKKEMPSYDTRKKLSDWQKGRKLPESTKKKLSDFFKGAGNPNYGKKHSEETRQKISDMRKGSNYRGKLVVDLRTGFFYDSGKLAWESQMDIKGYTNFKSMLNGQKINKTSFVYA